MEQKISFKNELWMHGGPGSGGWCFVTVPELLSKKIRRSHSESEEGWGRLKIRAVIGETAWETAIWFDTKHAAYLLPVKAMVRKKEKLAIGSRVSVVIDLKGVGNRPS